MTEQGTERVRPLEFRLTIHHSIHAESSIPPGSRVHHLPLCDTLMVPDDFLLRSYCLHLRWCLGSRRTRNLGCVAVQVQTWRLPATINCPEISKNNHKGKVCDEPVFTIVHGKTKVRPGTNTQGTSGERDDHAVQEQRSPPRHRL